MKILYIIFILQFASFASMAVENNKKMEVMPSECVNSQSLCYQNKIMSDDWFSRHFNTWSKYKSIFFAKENVRCLEVGSFEGRSTIFIAENFCNGKGSYTDSVDLWQGYDYQGYDGQMDHKNKELFDRFLHNTKKYIDEGKLKFHRNKSSYTLVKFVNEVYNNQREKYDFIYIDGSHMARDVILDAVLAWELLKVGGLMIFDDYELEMFPETPSKDPKPAIDGFLKSYVGCYKILFKEWQIHIQKTKEDLNS